MNSFRGIFPVTVGGKEVECRLTMNALRLFCGAEGVEITELEKYMSKDPLTALPTIAYWSYRNSLVYHQSKEKVIDKELFIMNILDEGQLEALSQHIGDALNDQDNEDLGNVKATKK